MAAINWKTAASGDFSTAANWNPAAVPGVADDALLSATGASYTVTSSTSNTVKDLQTVATATLSITGGTFTATQGTGSGSSFGQILVGNNTALALGGTVRNRGSIALQSIGNTTSLQILSAGATLTGGGTVTLSDNGSNRISGATAGATLTNVNNTISGGGQLGAGQMTFVNQANGVVSATLPTSLVIDTGASTLVNSGILEAAAGTLVISGTTVDNSAGGVVRALTGNVQLQSAHIVGGSLQSATGAIQAIDRGSLLDGTTSAVSNNAVVNILNNQYLGIAGSIVNSVSINLLSIGNDTALVVADDGATLSGGGTVTMSNNGSNRIVGATAGSTLTNVDNLIQGGGSLGNGRMTFVNQTGGIVRATQPTALVLETPGQTVENDGLFEATTGTFVVFNTTVDGTGGGLIRSNGGTVNLQSARLVGGTLRNLSGTVQVTDRGSVLDGDSTPQAVTVLGTLGITNNNYLTVQGSIDLFEKIGSDRVAGTIALQSIGNDTRLVVAEVGASLTSNGFVTMSDNASNSIVGTLYPVGKRFKVSRLSNNADISGAGSIGANLTLVNGGTISAVGSTALVISTGSIQVANSNVVTNRGVLQSINPGGLVSTGGLRIAGSVIAGGGIVRADGAATHVDLQTATIRGGTLETSNGGVVQAVDRGSLLDGTGPAVNVEGTVNILNNQYLAIAGTIRNKSSINLQSVGNDTRLTVAATGASLTGGGVVTLSNNASNSIVGETAAATLTNVDNTIRGGGSLGAGQLTFVNQAAGVVSATQPTALVVSTGAQTVVNAGLFEATTGNLVILGTTVDNSTGGTIRAAGGNVVLQSAHIVGGSLQTTTGAFQANDRGSLLDGTTSTVSLDGTLNILNNQYLAIAGAIDNEGSINLQSIGNDTRLTVAAAGATLTGGGVVALSDNGSNSIVGETAAATLTNVDNTIRGGGSLGAGQLTFVNQAAGVVSATQPTALVISTGAQTVMNAGLFEATTGNLAIVGTTVDNSGGGTIRAAAGNVHLQSAHIVGGSLESVTGVFQATDRGSVIDGTTSTVSLDGTLNVLNNQYLTLAGDIDNLGAINLQSVGNDTRLVVAAAGVRLDGGGVVTLSDNASNRIVGATAKAMLTNADNLIQGGGLIGAGQMRLKNLNHGTIEATVGTPLTIDTGAEQIVNRGTFEADAGRTLNIMSDVSHSGSLIVEGTMFLAGQVKGSGTATIGAGGMLRFADDAATRVTFSGGASTLQLDDSQAFTGKIAGFGPSIDGEQVLLKDIDFAGATKSYVGNSSAGVLTVTDGFRTANLSMVGNYTVDSFALSNDGTGHVRVTDNSAPLMIQSMAALGGDEGQDLVHFPAGDPTHTPMDLASPA